MMPLSVRTLERSDLKELCRIEEACFPSAWTLPQFRRFLALGGVRGLVVEAEHRALGFCVVRAEPSRLRVLNLAVAPAFRRRGVGTFILREIDVLAEQVRRKRIELEVRETNLAAQLLYRKAGYRAVDILRRHYEDEDGYLMRRTLTPPPDGSERA